MFGTPLAPKLNDPNRAVPGSRAITLSAGSRDASLALDVCGSTKKRRPDSGLPPVGAVVPPVGVGGSGASGNPVEPTGAVGNGNGKGRPGGSGGVSARALPAGRRATSAATVSSPTPRRRAIARGVSAGLDIGPQAGPRLLRPA